jgi:hypothetical protein
MEDHLGTGERACKLHGNWLSPAVQVKAYQVVSEEVLHDLLSSCLTGKSISHVALEV